MNDFWPQQPRPNSYPDKTKLSEMRELLPRCSRNFQFRMKYGNYLFV
jgi:hypothetical protein